MLLEVLCVSFWRRQDKRAGGSLGLGLPLPPLLPACISTPAATASRGLDGVRVHGAVSLGTARLEVSRAGERSTFLFRGSCCCLRFAVLCGQVPWINTQGESASVTCKTQRLAARQFSVLRQSNKPASDSRPHRPSILRGRRRGCGEPPTGRALTWGVVRGTPGGILSPQPASAWAPCGAPP